MARLVMGISGASGMPYAARLLTALKDHEVHLVASRPGREVFAHEQGVELAEYVARLTGQGRNITVHDPEDLFAPVASGSFVHDGMVVCPCSMKSLAGIATGVTHTLLERAADVTLKERRPLVLVTREMPLNAVHLKNQLAAHEAGAVIMPASPGFYNHPQTLEQLVDFMVSRILDHLHLDHELSERWKGK